MELYHVEERDEALDTIIKNGNVRKAWKYGYNEKHDFVVISKNGTIGEIYDIQGLRVALPNAPHRINKGKNKWVVDEMPKELSVIKSMDDWNKRDKAFKTKWIDYIDEEFARRDEGFWFMNNDIETYITGSHYMFMRWSKIDVGLPDFREANRILFLFWEACKADSRSFGMVYLKIRRSGFSYDSASEAENIGTSSQDARIGILSKTGGDAQKLFYKVVNININYPFFFKPTQSGMNRPKTELAFYVPSSRMSKSNMNSTAYDNSEGLNTTIDWMNTGDNSYDGEKLKLLIHDESAKILRPNSILNSWAVTKTCLRIGSKIIGKCMMGSSANKLEEGGANFKKLYENSNVLDRNKNGQTKSGLYKLFIPMEWNYEGFIDEYGFPILEASEKNPVKNIEGDTVTIGVVDYWQNEIDSFTDQDLLNEHYRQFPRTEAHAFRNKSEESLFNLTKIYDEIEYNDSKVTGQEVTRGYFSWMNGEKDTKVVWTPSETGRFNISWIPPTSMQNNVHRKGDKFYPTNEHYGAFGCDPFDISGVKKGSNGSLHGKTKFHLDENVPTNKFFLEYIARPRMAETFFEDVLMACFFYGMPILVESNKYRLLYHFKNRGYRAFSMNRPDKHLAKLSATELELGGIPNSSEDIIQAHADAIQTYIEKYVGYDRAGTYRDTEDIGNMPFNETLIDWSKFDIRNRGDFDASISSGLAIMATQKHIYLPEIKSNKIKLNFTKYDNRGLVSKILERE